MNPRLSIRFALQVGLSLVFVSCGGSLPDEVEIGQIESAVAERPPLPPISSRTPVPAPTTRAAPAGRSIVVVLDLDPLGSNSNSDVLGIRHTLDAYGIPYAVTSDVAAALRAPEMLIVAGGIEAGLMPSNTLSALRTGLPTWAAQNGHTLWLSSLRDATLMANLGVQLVPAAGLRDTLFVERTHPLAKYLDAPEEGSFLIYTGAAPRAYQATPTTWKLSPIARYNDGTAGAVLLESLGTTGRLVVLGPTFGNLLTRPENGLLKQPNTCSNVFSAAVDGVRSLIRRSYERYTKAPSLRPFAPQDKRAAVILTHDFDASNAYPGWRDAYMPLEKSLGFNSTLFIQTSYRSTGFTSGFYAPAENKAILAQSKAEGFNIQTHSVTHAPDFDKFPIGTEILDPAQYQPRYNSATATMTGGHILAELTLSAELLKKDLGVSVRGWRSGFLLRPKALPAIEEAAGFYYDANMCASQQGGAFPYLLLADYDISGAETSVLTFPLSAGDMYIETRTPEQNTAMWIDVTLKTAANGAPTVFLLHPNHPDIKLAAFQNWLNWLKTQPDLWVGGLDEYYTWYRGKGIRSEVKPYPF